MRPSTFDSALTLLREGRYVVALTGAGISTPSGIPDFRSPGSGLWEHTDPSEVASITSFQRNPARFYSWIRPLIHNITHAQPNPAHHALARLESDYQLKAVITQNIDMLHTRAGSRVVLEVHGNLREATCIHCFAAYPVHVVTAALDSGQPYPRCAACGHAVKPNVILYGEQLPAQILASARRESRRCDVMLVVGSSLEVYPSAQLPLVARRSGAALIIVNLTPTALDAEAQAVIRADAAEVLPRLVAALNGTSLPVAPESDTLP